MIDDKQVRRIANLARLKISDEECAQLKIQLTSILNYVKKLDELDTSNVEPLKQVIETENVLRPDEPRPSVSQEQALKNAPRHDGHNFIVPGVFED